MSRSTKRTFPSSAYSPRRALSRPAMAVTRLVLPEPEGPKIAVVSPGRASNETPRKTRTIFSSLRLSSSEPEPSSPNGNARPPRTVPSAFSTSSGGTRWCVRALRASLRFAPGARAPKGTPNGALGLVPPPNAGRTHRERSETSTASGGSNARRVPAGGGSCVRTPASSRPDSTRRVSTRASVVGASRTAAMDVVRSIFESTLRRRQEASRSAFSLVAPPAQVAALASWASERSSAMSRGRVEASGTRDASARTRARGRECARSEGVLGTGSRRVQSFWQTSHERRK